MNVVDLRSDTVTQPTKEMRRAMAEAEVGDDGKGEDPTVRALEECFAARVGKESSLFVPSGVMANQIALRLLARAGSSVVAGRHQHLVRYERGAAALNAGIQFDLAADDEGNFTAEAVAEAVESGSYHQVQPSLVCVENTHMFSGGQVWPIDLLSAVYREASSAALPVHMDGARLFNAEVASGVNVARWASFCTTVMCCLSKGLCAPVGSMLAGPEDLMAEARHIRACLGGQMRQAGILAAAGLVALRSMVPRLYEDHRRAAVLADVVATRWPSAGRDPGATVTNLVMFRHPHVERVLAHLRLNGVLASAIGPGVIRLVTHRDIDDDAVGRARDAILRCP